METLRVFIGHDGLIADTARSLFLHPNSLRHRLRRIEEIINPDPKSFDARTTFMIGLWDRRGRDQRRQPRLATTANI